jgi:hypothetical protein
MSKEQKKYDQLIDAVAAAAALDKKAVVFGVILVVDL